MKVARYSFSGSIPSKFKRKLCRHKQTFRKITTSCIRYILLDITYRHHLQQNFLAPGTVLTKSFTGAFFLQYGCLEVSEVEAESVRASVIEIFWDENFIVRKLIR